MDAAGESASAAGDPLIAPFAVRLRPSGRLLVLVLALHAATAALVWLMDLGPAAAVGVSVVLVAHCLYATRRALLVTPRSIVFIALGPGSACTVRRRDGEVTAGRIEETSIVTGSLVILSVAGNQCRLPLRISLLPGMFDPDLFRRLRVHLRWNRDPVSVSAS